MSDQILFRHAEPQDYGDIQAIYAHARQQMRETGNPNQWGDSRPLASDVWADIALGRSYVCVINGRIECVFMLLSGEEPTYAAIEDGAWQSSAPYHTVHRIASSGRVHGIFRRCIAWCYENFGYLRIDTHADNRIMQHLILKTGFTRSGIIRLADGSPRIAYEKL